jgi:hypothetical protein
VRDSLLLSTKEKYNAKVLLTNSLPKPLSISAAYENLYHIPKSLEFKDTP